MYCSCSTVSYRNSWATDLPVPAVGPGAHAAAASASTPNAPWVPNRPRCPVLFASPTALPPTLRPLPRAPLLPTLRRALLGAGCRLAVKTFEAGAEVWIKPQRDVSSQSLFDGRNQAYPKEKPKHIAHVISRHIEIAALHVLPSLAVVAQLHPDQCKYAPRADIDAPVISQPLGGRPPGFDLEPARPRPRGPARPRPPGAHTAGPPTIQGEGPKVTRQSGRGLARPRPPGAHTAAPRRSGGRAQGLPGRGLWPKKILRPQAASLPPSRAGAGAPKGP